MLSAADIDHAANTLRAMADIPCLRGGMLCFDENLRGESWREADECEVTWVWLPVPDDATDFAECRIKIKVAIDDARRELDKMINALSEFDRQWRADNPDENEGPLDHYFEKLARLEVA